MVCYVVINDAIYPLATAAEQSEAAAALREIGCEFACIAVLPGKKLPGDHDPAWSDAVLNGKALFRDGTIGFVPLKQHSRSPRVECERHPGNWIFAGGECEVCHDELRDAVERELLDRMRRK